MQYDRLSPSEREALNYGLASMPDYLESRLAGLPPDAARTSPAGFAPVEQCWHLADLEAEGFGVRIRRLLAEEAPLLPDFDGDRIARERNYRNRELAPAIAAFRTARERNLALLDAAGSEDWQRSGTQDGVGPVALCDLPVMMSRHDAAHREEIEAWLRAYERLFNGS